MRYVYVIYIYIYVGMFVAGWSIGVCTPIVTSMAGRVRGTDPTEAIAIVSSGQYLGMIAGPPLFGGLSGLLKGLRWSLLIDAGLVLMISAFGLFLDARLGYSTLPPLPSVDEFDRTSLVMVSVSAISPHPHERSSINSIRNSRTVSADDKLRKGQYSSMGYTAVNTEKDGE
jgi:MFS family permease